MSRYQRRTAPKVKGGTVQRKNRWTESPNIYNNPGPYPMFHRERPGDGYRHLIRKQDLYDFVDLLPDWDELSKGLSAVVLATGDPHWLGSFDDGVINIFAWEKELVMDGSTPEFVAEHESILSKLHVGWHKDSKDTICIDFDEQGAKAFQLIHVFVHELGHHHDKMTTRSKRESARGESYAEQYATKYEDEIIEKYWRYLDRR